MDEDSLDGLECGWEEETEEEDYVVFAFEVRVALSGSFRSIYYLIFRLIRE